MMNVFALLGALCVATLACMAIWFLVAYSNPLSPLVATADDCVLPADPAASLLIIVKRVDGVPRAICSPVTLSGSTRRGKNNR